MTLSALQPIQELASKLEIANQQLTHIRLEKIELEKEINVIKEENEGLKEENKSYYESSQMHVHGMSILQKVSSSIYDIDSYNDDLNIQISKQQNLIKKLKLKNIDLQKENKKYKIILEQINEEKQKRDEIQRNNRLNLENTIKELENECDRLREEINAFRLFYTNPTRTSPHCAPTPSPIYAKRIKSNDNIFQYNDNNTSLLSIFNEMPLSVELGYKTHSKHSIFNDNHVIINQLFDENETNIPTATSCNEQDVNCMDCKCEQYQISIQEKMTEIDILQNINNNSKSIIKTLEKQIRMIRRKNEELRLEIKKNENENNERNICKFNFNRCFS